MSKASHMRIGELAAQSGRSTHTIRWYDAQGLIPGVIRDPSGHRRFTIGHVQWLALLERLRHTGMSISQIRTYTRLVQQGSKQLPLQRKLLADHRDRVAATIDAWRDSLDLIDAKLAFYDRWMATGVRPTAESDVRKREAAVRSARSADARGRSPGGAAPGSARRPPR
jgi:DNA-binding transcriptional MerR regulator